MNLFEEEIEKFLIILSNNEVSEKEQSLKPKDQDDAEQLINLFRKK